MPEQTGGPLIAGDHKFRDNTHAHKHRGWNTPLKVKRYKMAGNALPWLPKTLSSPATDVYARRTPYSTIVKRTPANTRTSPQTKLSEPQFRYDAGDTQGWPSLSSAKEVSRENTLNRDETVAPAMVQTSETLINTEPPVLASPYQTSVSPPPDGLVTESQTMQTMAATSTRKKRRRKSSNAKVKTQLDDQSGINSGPRQLATPQLLVDSDVRSRPKGLSTPSQPVKVPDSGHQLVIVSAPQENQILQAPSPDKCIAKHTSGVLSFDLPVYHPKNPQLSFISEQQIIEKPQFVAPPPGMDNSKVVKYRTKYIGLLREEESEHTKKLLGIT